MFPLLIAGLGMQEILFLLLIVLLFFGGKKIPELMKGLGKGVRSFKDGVNGLEDTIKSDSSAADSADKPTEQTNNASSDKEDTADQSK